MEAHCCNPQQDCYKQLRDLLDLGDLNTQLDICQPRHCQNNTIHTSAVLWSIGRTVRLEKSTTPRVARSAET
eukprot:6310873-Amphidinium_carterae.1